MKSKTRSLTLMAILIAVMLVMGFVPNLGYIMIGPVYITLMGIPVVVGTLVLGLRAGLGMGALFALISLVKMFAMPDMFASLVVGEFGKYGIFYMMCLVIPRLLMPLSIWGVSRAVKMKKEILNLGAASLAGSLTNTVGYLLLAGMTLGPVISVCYNVPLEGAAAVVWGIALTNGLPEAVLVTLLCPPIVRALKKTIPPIETVKQKEITQ